MKINSKQKQLIEKQVLAISTVNQDGGPNIAAVAEARIVEEDKILITDNFMKTTKDNLLRDNRICIIVWSQDWNEAYKIIGKVKYFTSGKWFNFVKKMKENEGLPAKAAVLVTVEQIFSIA